jgi:hypothetical protein
MKNTFQAFLVLVAVVGFIATPVHADLGLAQIVANKGAPAVGEAVLAAAQTIYAGDAKLIKSKLIALVDEAVATKNEAAVRYAIVAVMMAGGVSNIELSVAAINDSKAFTDYKTVTAQTVAATKQLMTAGGGVTGGGSEKKLGGGDSKQLGGGSGEIYGHWNKVKGDDPFTWGSLTGPGSGDRPATPI